MSSTWTIPAAQLAVFRHNFSLITWLLIGACIQSIFVLLLPQRVAILPAVVLLAARYIKTALVSQGYLHNASTDNVVVGKMTAPILNEDGSVPVKASDKGVVCFVIGASSNDSRGLFAPGMKDMSAYFNGMFEGVVADRLNNGFLGKTSTFLEINDGSHITTLTISYWKDVECLHAFAHSPAHREGWDWWLKGRKEYPHLGIYHETFAAPAGHWENIYENMVPMGMGQALYPGTQSSSSPEKKKTSTSTSALLPSPDNNPGFVRPLVDAKSSTWRTMTARMGRPGVMKEWGGDAAI